MRGGLRLFFFGKSVFVKHPNEHFVYFLHLFICKFNVNTFKMPLKVALLHKSLSAMLANYPEPIMHSFLVSCNIFLPLGFVGAQLAEKQSVFILGRWMSVQFVNVKTLPSVR